MAVYQGWFENALQYNASSLFLFWLFVVLFGFTGRGVAWLFPTLSPPIARAG